MATKTMSSSSSSSSSSYSEQKDKFSSSGMIKYLRDQPPSHYLFKVKPFSTLLKSPLEKHESGVFEAGGYKWKLVVYPNGDKKANEKEHISLNLAIQETECLPNGWEVNIDLKLFVFDHLENKYLTVQDANGRIKTFLEMKTELGFEKFLPFETLIDGDNGYLVEDCCIFGAEVFVIQPTEKRERLSVVQEPNGASFSPKLEIFSKFEDDCDCSSSSSAGQRYRKMKIHDQKLYDQENGSSLSTFQRLKSVLSSVFQRQSSGNSLPYDAGEEVVEDELPEVDQYHGISRTTRDLPPAHYLFEIKSFSSLSKQEAEKHESDPFEVGGLKWKLCLYPNGCKERNGSEHISLYLRILETRTLPPDWEVYVNYKLFVFDQKKDNYLTVQDADGIVRRFHDKKTEWGFDQLLSLNTFNDASNGYLVNDSCIFGAEIFVIRHTCKKDSVSMVNNPANYNTYTWKIDQFSASKESQQSEIFTIGGRKWVLEVYPKGYGTAKDKWLSLYLYLNDGKSLPLRQEWNTEFKFRLRDQVNNNHIERTSKWCFKYPFTNGRGFGDFILLTDLRDASKGYLKSDTIIIEVIFTLLAVRDVLLEA